MVAQTSTTGSIGGLLNYLSYGKEENNNRVEDRSKRVGWESGRNLRRAESIEDAKLRFRQAAARKARRVEKPYYHVIVSWQSGNEEKGIPPDGPSREEMEETVDKILSELDLEEHQAWIVAHRDTSTPHVHVAVGRVHPRSGETWSPSYDQTTIYHALREIEEEKGWHRPGPMNIEDISSDEQRGLEYWEKQADKFSRKQSVRQWAREEDLPKLLKEANSWAEAEEVLHETEAALKPRRDRGMIIERDGGHAALSAIDPTISRPRLEQRFGQTWEEHRAQKEQGARKEQGSRRDRTEEAGSEDVPTRDVPTEDVSMEKANESGGENPREKKRQQSALTQQSALRKGEKVLFTRGDTPEIVEVIDPPHEVEADEERDFDLARVYRSSHDLSQLVVVSDLEKMEAEGRQAEKAERDEAQRDEAQRDEAQRDEAQRDEAQRDDTERQEAETQEPEADQGSLGTDLEKKDRLEESREESTLRKEGTSEESGKQEESARREAFRREAFRKGLIREEAARQLHRDVESEISALESRFEDAARQAFADPEKAVSAYQTNGERFSDERARQVMIRPEAHGIGFEKPGAIVNRSARETIKDLNAKLRSLEQRRDRYEEIKEEAARKEPTRKEPTRKEPTRKEPTRKEHRAGGEATEDGISEGEMSKEEMSKEEISKEEISAESKEIRSQVEGEELAVESVLQKVEEARERAVQAEIKREIESTEKSRSLAREAFGFEDEVQPGGRQPVQSGDAGIGREVQNGVHSAKVIRRMAKKQEAPQAEVKEASRLIERRLSGGESAGAVSATDMLEDGVRNSNEVLRQAARTEIKRAQVGKADGAESIREEIMQVHSQSRKAVMSTVDSETYDEEILEAVRRMEEDARSRLQSRAERDSGPKGDSRPKGDSQPKGDSRAKSRAAEAIERARRAAGAESETQNQQEGESGGESQGGESQGGESQGGEGQEDGRGRERGGRGRW
ncbi:relaxase/mobilization nuclease domain-containing protein [Salinibacter ruber]|uniref:relaxase/mobilization nuclease domain-containing protein n=1 Tax=Salinibacter ruber TaxID=146919 RepID=UPI00207310B7|nr:relaxase/mobilization nuclease domain-containing protein [Salinibacter ruber]